MIAFRKNAEMCEWEYLMICRKDTLGFIDFMRGKYSVYNKEYIMNMMKQMTVHEKEKLKSLAFTDLWQELWGNETAMEQYKLEENVSHEKFHMLSNGITAKTEQYSLTTMLEESMQGDTWEEAEWGFPKGRRNFQETDYHCAIREFCEETGYNEKDLVLFKNVLPFEETFTGSNYKSYKHKYYLAYFPNKTVPTQIQENEIQKAEWKTYAKCVESIRYYNLEKLDMLKQVHTTLCQLSICVEA